MIKDRLLFDGAFGSYYYALTGDEAPCELANGNRPEMVREIHKRYIESGAQAIKTNTFAANTAALKSDFALVAGVLQKGYEIAREAAGNAALVFADIGPFRLDDDEKTVSEYLAIADVFLKLGAYHFLFETFPEFELMRPVLSHIKKNRPDAFLIFSFAASEDGYTRRGNHYKPLLRAAMEDENVDSAGLNCISGPSHILKLFRDLPERPACASVMPNAGYPTLSGGRILYNDNAAYFAEKLLEIAQSGAKILGGCCGTTPAHIAEAARLLNLPAAQRDGPPPAKEKKVAAPSKNIFREKLKAGEKVIAVELSPPLDTDVHTLIERAKAVRNAGADVITLPDSPLSRARADSVMCASIVKREAKIDVLPHLSCRDRNMIGIKSILLAGRMGNVGNVLALTGDPMVSTGESGDRGVFSLHSQNLISYIVNLNADVFGGNGYFIGGALNVNAPNFEAELRRACNKEKNGAEFFMTQPVFSERAKENLHRAHETLKAKILAGIMPVAGYKNAVFINNEISGITIPEELVESLRDKTREEAASVTVRYCKNLIEDIKGSCDGYYLITPLGRIDLICAIINAIKEKKE